MTKNAILFVNLGSPKSPELADVKTYLKEFLMDKYVIDAVYPLRWFIVNKLILPKRPKESSAAYKTIWTEDGSPLISISKKFLEKISPTLKDPAYLAMRYQDPSIQIVLSEICKSHPNLKTITLCPMYPHYAMSSVTTVVEKTKNDLKKINPSIQLKIIPPFYNNPKYIASLSRSLTPYLKPNAYVLFSYHGLPERHLMKTDTTGSHCLKVNNCCEVPSDAHKTCYFHQIKQTTALVAQSCQLKEGQFSFACQSRLGKDPWIKPYTDLEIVEIIKKGFKNIVVISPSFVADCLETIEELGDRLRSDWTKNGGESFDLVPCLNTEDHWIENFSDLVKETVS
ncbi:ferrochelatase [Candidatus Marinamargulisbacteria bacterium SCGC AAA071-K20]|nr:ferrochelatase [Candidatus Marinamargulisbacteria bacterium SCGC AAA071-K20]